MNKLSCPLSPPCRSRHGRAASPTSRKLTANDISRKKRNLLAKTKAFCGGWTRGLNGEDDAHDKDVPPYDVVFSVV